MGRAKGPPPDAPSPDETPAEAAQSPEATSPDAPSPDETYRRDALRFLAAMVAMREALADIHAAQTSGQDGTAAVGAFTGALLAVGGRLPGFPPNPWTLKQLLDAPRYDAEDPQRNSATKALVAYLFECLELGRVRPHEGESDMARVAEHWPQFRTRSEAVAFEESHARETHTAREQRFAEEHHQRRAVSAPKATRRVAAEPPEVVEPPDLTVG